MSTRTAWNKGIPCSNKIKKKISETIKKKIKEGSYDTSNLKKFEVGHTPWNEGKQYHMKHDKQFKKGQISWNKNKTLPHQSEETIKKRSDAMKKLIAEGKFFSEEHCRKISENQRGKVMSEESKEKNRISHLGKKDTEETKQKKRKKSLKNWQNPEYAQKVLKGEHKFPNKAEQKLDKIMQQILPNEYKYVGDGQVIIQGKCPDFININGQKKIVELFGNYWHEEDDEPNRKFIFNLFGYETLVVWENELKDMDTLQSKLIQFNNK